MSDRPWVGADIGGTKLLLVALAAGPQTPHRTRTGPDAGPALIEGEIRAFVAALPAAPAGLGIAVPGLVDAAGNVVACDVLPKLVGWRPANALADLGCPVRVLNDAEAALVEEAHDLRPEATAGIVMAGTSIGAAFRVHGAPLRGARGWAGELGYLPVAVDGERVAPLHELAGGASVAHMREPAARGDADALAAIRRAGEALGLGLAAVVNLLNPEMLVLGGGALQLPGYRAAALGSAERHSLPELWRVCTLRPASGGDAVVALGAIRAVRS